LAAGFRIDFLEAVVGHVGNEDAVLVVDRQVVERQFELRHHFLGAGFRVNSHQLFQRGIATHRLPLESKLAAAGTLNPSATTVSSALSTVRQHALPRAAIRSILQ
jgi:hypothetical protein